MYSWVLLCPQVGCGADYRFCEYDEAKVEKIPHVLVVGKDDVANETVGENVRGSDEPERDLPFTEFISRLTAEVEERQ